MKPEEITDTISFNLEELGKELDCHYVFDSLASIMKPEEITDTISFNLEELEESTANMIS